MEAGTGVKAVRPLAALAGFEAGIFAVLLMLAWLALASAWNHHSIWQTCNLVASTFYGEPALRNHFSAASLTGLSFYVILYSLFGAAFAAVAPAGATRLRVSLIGILAGLAWYYLWFSLVWPHANRLIALYTHDRPMLWGHMLYGALLGRYPAYLPRAVVQTPLAEPAKPLID